MYALKAFSQLLILHVKRRYTVLQNEQFKGSFAKFQMAFYEKALVFIFRATLLLYQWNVGGPVLPLNHY